MRFVTIGRTGVVELAVVAAAIVAAALPPAPLVVETWFAAGVYPVIQRTLTAVSNAVPFAVLDLLLALGLGLIVVAVARAVRGVGGTRQAAPVLHLIRRLAVAGAAVYLAFLLLWGFNYRRVQMQDRLLVEPGAPAPEAVVQLGLTAVSELNALHAKAHETGWSGQPSDDARLRRAFVDVQGGLSDARPATPGRLKRSILGAYFRWASVDGMINPFGLEVLANPDLLPFERPFVAAHEWAHLAGYADEAEASLVGWLTCVRADAPAGYSGWLALYWQVRAELNESERSRLAEALAPGPREDLEAIAARVRLGEWPWLRDAGWRVYDRYLKVNRVEEGVRSYGAVVTLILRTRFEPGWQPVRRTAATSPG